MTTIALVLHGESGSWDEIVIAVLALAVLWIAVKLAGRKAASDDDDDHDDGTPPREPEAPGVRRRG